MRILACPRCHSGLRLNGRGLFCNAGHRFPVIDGVPVFIIPEAEQTISVALASHDAANNGFGSPLYVETLGLSGAERREIDKRWAEKGAADRIDPVISYLVGATSGLGYKKLVGRMADYPIPRIPTGPGEGQFLLDLGCGWGRWSISAARNGWNVVGIDPSLGALMAARRAFKGEPGVMFACGDARFLPFRSDAFRSVFSYSVLQHFSEKDAERALAEAGRVLQRGGASHIQMAHLGGLRARYVLSRPGYEKAGVFRVRYWSLDSLRTVFGERIGRSVLVPEAFGGLGLLFEDWRHVSTGAKFLIAVSEFLKRFTRYFQPLIRLADSVFVVSVKS